MELKEFFEQNNKVALGFSGGADSAYLLRAGIDFGADIRPYFAHSCFQPEFEREDAERLCRELGTELKVLDVDILGVPQAAANGPGRCYYCKRAIFSAVREAAEADGYHIIIDGTNASDDISDRPGMQAVRELGVLSPLRLCGITKDTLRALSRQAGLFTWNKPSYSCLATRIRTGEPITAGRLQKIEEGEKILFYMGFSDFRLRTGNGSAVLQVRDEQAERAAEKFPEIRENLKELFPELTLDEKYRQGEIL